ncbi:MAG: T9SS type A sorting domain-containing protein [Cyclobacteriaceae bacterium]
MYPNPVSNTLSIYHASSANLIITDLLGRELLKSNQLDKEMEINVSDWPSGVYLVRLVQPTTHAVRTYKVLKQ